MSCFLCFFHRYLKATLFSLKTKNHTVILLIMGGQNVDISLVLAMILKICIFRRRVFNDFLSRFRCKNHVHWWSPRFKNSGNPCAKVIILVSFVFFGSLTCRETCENHEISKSSWRYPQRLFGDFHENMKVDVWKIWFFRIALELVYKAFRRFSGSLPCSYE